MTTLKVRYLHAGYISGMVPESEARDIRPETFAV